MQAANTKSFSSSAIISRPNRRRCRKSVSSTACPCVSASPTRARAITSRCCVHHGPTRLIAAVDAPLRSRELGAISDEPGASRARSRRPRCAARINSSVRGCARPACKCARMRRSIFLVAGIQATWRKNFSARLASRHRARRGKIRRPARRAHRDCRSENASRTRRETSVQSGNRRLQRRGRRALSNGISRQPRLCRNAHRPPIWRASKEKQIVKARRNPANFSATRRFTSSKARCSKKIICPSAS
jgi:hypothetical protein